MQNYNNLGADTE